MMKDYATFYENVKEFLEERPILKKVVLLANEVITRLIYVLYPLFLIALFIYRGPVYSYVLVPAAGFMLVTIIRKVLNQARPYEKWATIPLMKKETKGQSMPSRHVFSATVISMTFLHFEMVFGMMFLCLSLVLAICRVLGGVHYPKDVAVGYTIGVLVGLPLFFV